MIHAVAVITTQPGRRAAFLAACRASPPRVRAEAGRVRSRSVHFVQGAYADNE